MLLNLHEAAVQSSLIATAGSILSALVTALCAAIIGHQISGRKRLQEKLDAAVSDIAFLLAVERLHCNERAASGDASLKNTIRERARSAGEHWSGRFTPGRYAGRASSH